MIRIDSLYPLGFRFGYFRVDFCRGGLVLLEESCGSRVCGAINPRVLQFLYFLPVNYQFYIYMFYLDPTGL